MSLPQISEAEFEVMKIFSHNPYTNFRRLIFYFQVNLFFLHRYHKFFYQIIPCPTSLFISVKKIFLVFLLEDVPHATHHMFFYISWQSYTAALE